MVVPESIQTIRLLFSKKIGISNFILIILFCIFYTYVFVFYYFFCKNLLNGNSEIVNYHNVIEITNIQLRKNVRYLLENE